MTRKSLKETLMERDGITKQEATELIHQAKEELYELLAEGCFYEAEDICYEFFGLEPDYLEDLI